MAKINLDELTSQAVKHSNSIRGRYRQYEMDTQTLLHKLAERYSQNQKPALNRYFNDQLVNSGSVSDALKMQSGNFLDLPKECYAELVQMGYATVDNQKEIGFVVNINYELLFAGWLFETQLLKSNSVRLIDTSIVGGKSIIFEGELSCGLETKFSFLLNNQDEITKIAIGTGNKNPVIISGTAFNIYRDLVPDDIKRNVPLSCADIIIDEHDKVIGSFSDLTSNTHGYKRLEEISITPLLLEAFANEGTLGAADKKLVSRFFSQLSLDHDNCISELINESPIFTDGTTLVDSINTLLNTFQPFSGNETLIQALSYSIMDRHKDYGLSRDGEFAQLNFLNYVEDTMSPYLTNTKYVGQMNNVKSLLNATQNERKEVRHCHQLSQIIDISISNKIDTKTTDGETNELCNMNNSL